jgi:hypothetical protein
VLLALVIVPLAAVVFVLAFFFSGPADVGVAERRPPPAGGYTHAVGDVLVGGTDALPYDGACAEVTGLRVAGSEGDRDLLRRALATLCNAPLERAVSEALGALASAEAEVRFAAFEATGVDSTVELTATPPRVLVNARFAQAGRPGWIAPLLAHDAVMAAGDPHDAERALAARRAEAAVCEAVLGTGRPSRGCEDAEAVLALEDPLAALREAGYR